MNESVILKVPRDIFTSQDCDTKRQVLHLCLLQAWVPERFSVVTRLQTNRSRMSLALRNTTRGGSTQTLQALVSALRISRFWKMIWATTFCGWYVTMSLVRSVDVAALGNNDCPTYLWHPSPSDLQSVYHAEKKSLIRAHSDWKSQPSWQRRRRRSIWEYGIDLFFDWGWEEVYVKYEWLSVGL